VNKIELEDAGSSSNHWAWDLVDENKSVALFLVVLGFVIVLFMVYATLCGDNEKSDTVQMTEGDGSALGKRMRENYLRHAVKKDSSKHASKKVVLAKDSLVSEGATENVPLLGGHSKEANWQEASFNILACQVFNGSFPRFNLLTRTKRRVCV
jgi:hypothetical protein